MRGDEKAKKILLKHKASSLFITEISVYEVSDGLFRTKSKKDFNKFIDFISTLSIIPATGDFALEAARIGAELRSKGTSIDDSDLLIAGMMRSYGFEKIITRNKKHFSKIKGIEVITY